MKQDTSDQQEKKIEPKELKPRILIPCGIWEKIMYWVDKASFEVSGFGKCKFNGTDFEVTSAILLKQEGGAAHTDIDPESLSRAQYLLKDEPGELKFWWHSHVNMATFMSSTDKDTLVELGKHGWALACVFNKKREVTSAACYQVTTPFGNHLHYADDLRATLLYPALSDEQKVILDKEYDENVKQKVWTGNGYGALTWKDGKWWNADGTEHKWSDDYHKRRRFTFYEEEGAEALGITPYQFKVKYKKATEDEKNVMDDEIRIYWVDLRGWAPNRYDVGSANDYYDGWDDLDDDEEFERLQLNMPGSGT